MDTTKHRKGSIEEVVARKLAAGEQSNRLIKEKSPYLLQHAFNPVDWYPWGEEAFRKAREEDKPIFLSIGYSTCYWCHVMEREVFENDSIAELMNNYVISIKVDREERPDVDRIYMSALMGMTGSGGWPMSMFLTPEGKPFFGATYLPGKPSHGRSSFPEILTRIHEIWITDRKKVIDITTQLVDYIHRASTPETNETKAGAVALDDGFGSFSGSYDSTYAGFGGAPKFPRPVAFNFLFRYYARTGKKKSLEMSLETLRRMAAGGMYDHLGGGFHRYSTDAAWHVPHFEKMLYDQAQLVVSYLEAYQITRGSFFSDVARDILRYVSRDMTDPAGGFYSAEDAESLPSGTDDASHAHQNKEGAFYTWKKEEIDGVLPSDEAMLFNFFYDVRENGNVETNPQNEFNDVNILHQTHSMREAAEQFQTDEATINRRLASARSRLFDARNKRSRPHLDDKILVSWNGLMISAYSRAYEILGDDHYLERAEKAGSFLLKALYRPHSQELLHRYRDGEARIDGTLEDYAFLIQGLIDLYEASLDIQWLSTAIELADKQIALFYDAREGGFYDSGGSDNTLFVRTKESYDGAEPSGNSIAILNLLRLSQMTGNQRYQEIAEKSLHYFGQAIVASPHALAQFLVALDFSLSKPMQVIIAGKAGDPHTRAILREVHHRFIPGKIVLLADEDEGQRTLSAIIPFLESVRMIDGKSTAYICEDYVCKLPTSDPEAIARLLDEHRKK